MSTARVKGTSPELKVLIIICYFGMATVFALIAYATTFWIGSVSHVQQAFSSYVLCEATGLQSNSTMACDRTELNTIIPIQAMFDAAYILFLMIPIINLTYALNMRDLRALKQRCMKRCMCWCKIPTSTGKKQPAAAALVTLSSI